MLSKNLVEEPPIRNVGGDTGSFASRTLSDEHKSDEATVPW
jgi:hypothetical protein